MANLWELARIVLGPSEFKSLLGDLVPDMMLLVPWDMPHSMIGMRGHMRSRATITYPGLVRIETLDARIKQPKHVEFGESIALGENWFLDGGIQKFRLPFGRVLCIPNEVHHMRQYLTAEFEVAAQKNSIAYTDHNPMTRPDRNNCWLLGKITVLQRVGSGRYKIHTKKGENVFHTMDLKPCLESLDNGRNSVHWYTDVTGVVETPSYQVEKILKHRSWTDRKTKKKNLEWYVKYRGYDEPEWQPASAFMHDVSDQWAEYNKSEGIDIGLTDIRPDILL